MTEREKCEVILNRLDELHGKTLVLSEALYTISTTTCSDDRDTSNLFQVFSGYVDTIAELTASIKDDLYKGFYLPSINTAEK